MDKISYLAKIICVVAICSSILSLIVPDGKMQRVFKYVLSLFLVCAVIIPLKGISIEEFFKNNEELSISETPYQIEDKFDNLSKEYLSQSVVLLIEEKAKTIEIIPLKTEIIMDNMSDKSISITKAIIYIARENADKKEELKQMIQNELGINCDIYISEDKYGRQQ